MSEGAGVETVLAQEWARQVGPDPDVEDWGWYPDWRGDRPPGWWARVTARTGTGEDMWVHADVVAGVVVGPPMSGGRRRRSGRRCGWRSCPMSGGSSSSRGRFVR